ncbi:MAG: SHOCT domain-containing protein [candidate division Zixibacteria bacterium]|nr:SHOCT domain-containing protein [candidate division Zixibacteria bacterium]
MYESAFFDSYWWIFPLVMMALCFLMMRGRMGSMMCGFGSRDTDNHRINPADSAIDILEKRFALGEIGKEEYEEKKKILNQRNATNQ